MAKTAVKQSITRTRNLEEIVAEFAQVTDSGSLRYHQARLAFEFVGNTEGKEAAELKEKFAREANEALRRRAEKELSVPGVTNLVSTWQYMLRANLDTSPGEDTYQIAKAAFGLASQSFRKKEDNYVIPAIQAIQNGEHPVKAFQDAQSRLIADKKAAAQARKKTEESDEAITYDAIVAVLQVIPTKWDTLDESEKAAVRDLIANLAPVVA